MKIRTGEQEKTRFRSERHYSVSGNYYFSTREGVEIGPFKTKSELEQAMGYFIEIIGKLSDTCKSS